MTQELQIPTSKQKRDGEIRILSNGMCIEMRGNYSESEILDAMTPELWDEIPYDREYMEKHARWTQAWWKTVPDGSGEYTWVTHGRNTPCRGSYFASTLSLW